MAGHFISYNNLKQVDTALAESALLTMEVDTGAMVPPNFVPKRFVHFTCDNIDINNSIEIMEQRSPAAVVSGKTEPGSIIQTN